MNDTLNKKIEQVTDKTLIVGVDIRNTVDSREMYDMAFGLL